MSGPEPWAEEARAMVDRLPPMSAEVADAMRRVPRHVFVSSEYRRTAYADEPLPLPFGEATISAPHMVALQLDFAEVGRGHRVLEVGVGSGYLAALLATLVGPSGAVYGLDIEAGLVREAERRVGALALGVPVHLRLGDGREGWPDAAPFDRILVSCATPSLRPEWQAQTREGGILVAPVGDAYSQVLTRLRKTGPAGRLEAGPECRFVPLRGVSDAIYRP